MKNPKTRKGLKMDKRPAYLLPENVRPKKYNVWLQPNLENFTFRGINEIGLEIREPADEIVLHTADLTITHPILVVAGEEKKCNEINLNPENQTATFKFGTLEPGEATLYINFTGEINDSYVDYIAAFIKTRTVKIV